MIDNTHVDNRYIIYLPPGYELQLLDCEISTLYTTLGFLLGRVCVKCPLSKIRLLFVSRSHFL